MNMNSGIISPPSYKELWAEQDLAKLYKAFRAILEKGVIILEPLGSSPELTNINKNFFIQDGKLTQLGKDYLAYLYRRPIDDELEKSILPWLITLPDEAFTAPGSMIKITNSPSPTAS